MASYCTIDDVRNIVPKSITIGTNILKGDVNVTEDQVIFWIEETAGVIDGYISSFYRIPLMPYKEPDYSVDPITFTERFPHPIILINARLAAANLFDRIIMANQEPNVSEWGKNQRALAMDDINGIMTGFIQLRGQVKTGMRFVRQELHDPSRIPANPALSPISRAPGV